MTPADQVPPVPWQPPASLAQVADVRAAAIVERLVQGLTDDQPELMPGDDRRRMFVQLMVEIRRDRHDPDDPVRQFVFGGAELDDIVAARRPLIEQAQRFFDDNGVAMLTALFHASLPEAYLGARGVQVLDATGELYLNWTRRIQETGQFLVNVLSPAPQLARYGRSSLTSGEFAARATRRVRLIHAAIRWMLAEGVPEPVERFESQLTAEVDHLTVWKAKLIAAGLENHADDEPLNQQDLLATLGTFTTVVLRALEKLGVAYDDDDRAALAELWNVVAWHLGIGDQMTVPGDVGPPVERWPDNALLPIDADALDCAYDGLAQQLQRPTDAGRRMAKALTQELAYPLPRALQGAPAFVARYLVGDTKADALAIEQGGIAELLVLRSGALERWTSRARAGAVGRQAVGLASQRITRYAIRMFIAQARWSDRGLTIDPHVAARWGIQIPPDAGPPARRVTTTGADRERSPAFLFTDIQRSTRLWSEHTTEMASAITEHNRAIARLVTQDGGTLLKNTGDGVLAMFDDGTQGIRAAVDIQRWLDQREWGNVGRLLVRMGLHAGEPVVLDTGEITGPVINECARLHAAGHGGQVLVSARLAAQVQDRLPLGCSLKSLGEHRLPDLAPATIHQLCHPDLRAEFPPLRTAVGSDLDLVGRSRSFHGRERELAELDALDGSRLVTLVGPGGVGKTRLAQVVAARRGAAHADGVRIIDLSAIVRPDEVVDAVATTLRIEHTAATATDAAPPSQQVAQWLQAKDILLMLDNCEHVRAAVATLAVELLATAPRLHLLCTSRQALGVDDERVYVVPPLPVGASGQDARDSAAVELFVDRARDVRPGFRPDARELLAIQQVCRQLDGLPLAIELAAARLVVDDLDAVEAVLHPPPLRVVGPPATAVRHRSLRELVAWSFDTLSDQEQRLFARLSVFAGPFTMRAAREVCGRVAPPLDDIPALTAALVEKSMVEATDGTTLRLLAPIRSAAVDLLADTEQAQLRQRHVEWYAGWAAELSQALRGPDEEGASLALAAEFGNLRAAHRFALEDGDEPNAARIVAALLTFAVHRFRFEVANWADASLKRSRTPDDLRPTLHGLLGIRAWMRGDLALASRHADEAVAVEERLRIPPAIHPRLVRLAVAGYERRFEDAFNEFTIADRRARDLGHLSWRVEVLVFSAVGMSQQGAYDIAAGIAERAASMAAELQNPTSMAWARYAVAESVYHDQPAAAIEYLEEAIELARRVGNEWVLGLVTNSIATRYRRLGQIPDAAIALLDCLDRWSRAENWSEQWRTVREVAHVCASVGRFGDSAWFLAASAAARSVIPVSPLEAEEILRLQARFELALGTDARQRVQERGRLRSLVAPEAVVATAHQVMLDIVRGEVSVA